MANLPLLLPLLLFTIFLPNFSQAKSSQNGIIPIPKSINDETLVDLATGRDVVFASLSKIQSSYIFLDDFDILKRIALVESEFGASPTTFPPDYYGGLWQVSESQFFTTKDASLATFHDEIGKKFKIDWQSTNWTNLLAPLYSALGARLYLEKISPKPPQTLATQADLWKNHYSDDTSSSAQYFIDLVTAFESSSLCKGNMDLLVVLDESGSIGSPNFELAKQFVAKLFGSYSLDNVRQGFLTFSTGHRTHFEIENDLTAPQIQDKVLTLGYGGGGTDTNGGILEAVAMFSRAPDRHGVPKIMTLFTDGGSNDGVSNIQYAKAANITSFGIGIGNYNSDELLQIAYGDQTHVFKLDDFDALTEFFGRLNSETCDIPTKPPMNETIEEEIELGEKRIYYFPVPPSGLNVFLYVDEGNVTTYFSYTVQSPSGALNDGQIVVDGETYLHPSFSKSVYISVEGKKETNKYFLLAVASLEETPDFGSDGRCFLEGLSPHTNDCTLYHECAPNPVGDLWDTIRQCPNDGVFCKDSLKCGSVDVCPCDI